MNIQGRS